MLSKTQQGIKTLKLYTLKFVHLRKKIFSVAVVISYIKKEWEEALVGFWKKGDKIAAKEWWVVMANKMKESERTNGLNYLKGETVKVVL